MENQNKKSKFTIHKHPPALREGVEGHSIKSIIPHEYNISEICDISNILKY